MVNILNAIDHGLVILLNAWIGGSVSGFSTALWVSEHLPWLVAAAVLAALWFSGEPGAIPTRSGARTRIDNRRLAMMMFAALLVVLGLCRAIQSTVDRTRPLAEVGLNVPIDEDGWNSFRNRVGTEGAFPSSSTAVSLVIVVALFAVKRSLGLVSVVGCLVLSIFCIGVGLSWPTDVLAGAMVGILSGCSALMLIPLVRRALDVILMRFEYDPALMYSVSFLVMFDLSQQFSGLRAALKLIGWA